MLVVTLASCQYGYCKLKNPIQLRFQFALYQIWLEAT